MPIKRKPDSGEVFIELRKELADEVSARFVSSLLENIPVESGHGHEAICAALDSLPSSEVPGIAEVSKRHGHERSGDRKAANAGTAWFFEGAAHHTVFLLSVELPFLKKMDEGGTIEKISPGGQKPGGLATMGELYATRSSKRPGWLFWEEGGVTRFAVSRVVHAHNFSSAAEDSADITATSLGFRKA